MTGWNLKNAINEFIRIYLLQTNLGAITTGAITSSGITNTGNINVNSGSVLINTNTGGLRVASGGAGSYSGSNALVGGTVTVATTAVSTSNQIILLTSQVDGGTPGWLRVSGKTNGQDFTITSSSGTDTSTIGWLIVDI